MARRGIRRTPELEEAVRREAAARRADAAAKGSFAYARSLCVREVDQLAGGGSAAARLLGIDNSTVSHLLRKLAAPGRDQHPPAGRFLGPRGAECYELDGQAEGAVHARDVARLAGLDAGTSGRKEGVEDAVRRGVVEWGERLVPVLVARAAEDLPHHRVETTGLWAHRDRPWQWATPERLLVPVTEDAGYGVLECVALAEPLGSAWGTPDVPDLPEDVRARALWTADTLGAGFALVVALGGGWDYRAVRVEHDPAQASALRGAVAAAMPLASATNAGG
ncbi:MULTISPECIES: hypothetical protein [unclassified Streptomyces]|uniref:hypothetical protein n=1 Tax=unclassified Streptomyces TaxID=2593676 RepID=UPI000BACE7C7|nr:MULTISPECIES: hypothetical protein [unclassified Streptomyces]ASY37035.1 hypothetical protein CAC01_30830 [Streptomyces sp. CLI2509]MYX23501.1 hypothetical protein [Streptomyces sp. SID8380]